MFDCVVPAMEEQKLQLKKVSSSPLAPEEEEGGQYDPPENLEQEPPKKIEEEEKVKEVIQSIRSEPEPEPDSQDEDTNSSITPLSNDTEFDIIGEKEVWEASGPEVMKDTILSREDSAIQDVIEHLNHSKITDKVRHNKAWPIKKYYSSKLIIDHRNINGTEVYISRS